MFNVWGVKQPKTSGYNSLKKMWVSPDSVDHLEAVSES